MRHVRRTLGVALVLAGLAATQQACGTAEPAPPAPAASVAPTATGAPPADVSAAPTATTATATRAAADDDPAAILDGRRQVTIKLVQDPDGVLAVGAGKRLDVSDGEPSLFALAPTGDSFRIHTGTATDREPSCLAIRPNGSDPLTVVATACDSGDTRQAFSLRPVGTDAEGRPTYYISNDGVFLQWFPGGRNGLIAQEIGDDDLDTTFVFLDRGPNTLPTAGD